MHDRGWTARSKWWRATMWRSRSATPIRVAEQLGHNALRIPNMTPLPHSLRELLADRLDYAGLFPPAGHPLESAFRNYVAYQHHEHSWLLGRFVCRAARLIELSGLVEQWPEESPLRLSVVARPSTNADAAPATRLSADLGLINAFHVQHRERVQVESFETSLVPELVSATEQ